MSHSEASSLPLGTRKSMVSWVAQVRIPTSRCVRGTRLTRLEWVEEHAAELSKHAIAYLNVDVASSGVDFAASASPLLFDVLRNVTSLVPAVKGDASLPGTDPIRSLRDEWHGLIRTLGSGSDYTAFQDALGITSIDMGFKAGKSSQSVYHYHSQYDSFHWLTTMGDPGLRALQASTRLWGLLAYRLAESPVIGYNASTYGTELERYVHELSSSSSSSPPSSEAEAESEIAPDNAAIEEKYKSGLARLARRARAIRHYGTELDARAAAANHRVSAWPTLSESERRALLTDIHAQNDAYKHFERALLDPRGLDGRDFFKHVLYAPGRWTGYAGAVFPSITEAASRKDAVEAMLRVAEVLGNVGRT